MKALLICLCVAVLLVIGKTVALDETLPPQQQLDQVVETAVPQTDADDYRFRRIDENNIGAVLITHGRSSINVLMKQSPGQPLIANGVLDTRSVEDAFPLATPILRNHWVWFGLMLFVGGFMIMMSRGLRRLDALLIGLLPLTLWGFQRDYLQLTMGLGIGLMILIAARVIWNIHRRPAEELVKETTAANNIPQVNTVQQRLLTLEEWLVQQKLHYVLMLLVGFAVIGLTTINPSVIDVGQSSLAGATQILNGNSPYGNIEWIFHGDTYPPLSYVLFIPPALLSPVIDQLSDYGFAVPWMLLMWMAAAALIVRLCRKLEVLAPTITGLAISVSPPLLFLVGAGNNDVILLVCFLGALSGSRWLLAIGIWAKLLTLPMLLAHRDWQTWAITAIVGFFSCTLLIALDGFGTLVDMVEAVSFQVTRGSLREPSLIISPVVGIAFQVVGITCVLWSIWSGRQYRPGTVGWVHCGILGALGLQIMSGFWNPFYVGWLVPLLWIWLVTTSPVSQDKTTVQQLTSIHGSQSDSD